MKLLKRLVSVLAIVLAVASNAFADDEVRIVIDEGVDGARPIAVVPFAGSAPEDISKIVADYVTVVNLILLQCLRCLNVQLQQLK